MCIWENLIDYKEKTYNPSIREDFISTRFYAMTFSPNKTNGERPNLINSTDLVYMPTYESDKKAMIIQMFISQAFINSFISSYADRGVLNQILVSKSNNILDNSCYNIIYMLYPKPKGDWRLNIYLEKVSEIKITAGQLYQNSTTFKFEFVDPTENKTYAIAHFEFWSWSSFRMKGNFTIENINLGNPTEDYNITWFSSQSDYGDLKDWKQITNGFSKAINAYLAKYPTFNIYEAFFKGKDKLKYLNIAFNETEFNLIDRYISLYSKPDFSQMLKFLQQAFWNESWAKSGEYWFWKVVCINYEPMEPSLINHEAFMQRLLNPKEKPNIESRKQTNRRSHLYPRDPRFRTDIL